MTWQRKPQQQRIVTPPKNRRIGFSLDNFGRATTNARDGVWTESAREFGRMVYLTTLGDVEPQLLKDLFSSTLGAQPIIYELRHSRFPAEAASEPSWNIASQRRQIILESNRAHAGVRDWARRWRTVSSNPTDEWGFVYALSTVATWASIPSRRRLFWDFNRFDAAGVWVDDSLPLESRPLVNHEHFEWLARYQLDVGYRAIARDAKTAESAVRAAVPRLAEKIELALRTPLRGRPEKKIHAIG